MHLARTTWQVNNRAFTHDTLQPLANLCFVQLYMTEAMSVVVAVGLISGKTVLVEAQLDEPVVTLKRRAETALQVGRGRLLDSSGGLLDDEQTVQEAKLETGSRVTLQVGAVQVLGACGYSHSSFSAILGDGSVGTWGDKNSGGDSGKVQEQLKGVQHIQASYRAFAAILTDGSAVTWGEWNYGGASGSVQDQLKGVEHIQASRRAFAAILVDGSVVTWGDENYGGDSRAVQDQLKGVQTIQASECAFAALLSDGSVVTWGHPNFGGDSGGVQDQLKGVQQIQARRMCFCSHPDRRIGCYLGRQEFRR